MATKKIISGFTTHDLDYGRFGKTFKSPLLVRLKLRPTFPLVLFSISVDHIVQISLKERNIKSAVNCAAL
jgi:hypothetical protein